MFHFRRGSLLINLGIVLAIVLLLVSLSIPSISAVRRFLVRTEVEKLYSIFYYLKQRAITLDEDQVLLFDIQHNALSSTSIKQQLVPGVEIGFLKGSYGPPSQPSKLIRSGITFKDNKVIFYADGTVSAGTLYLVDRDHKYMYALTSPISQISFIRMYCYNNGSWILLK
jgi:type II secretory pathway pseudopilin PulG